MLPLLAVALVSAGALAFEVLLTRLFSIIQWHHFAYMVISIALLGYGASGAFLAVTGNRLGRHVGAAFATGAILFAASTVASFAVAERLPFNALVAFPERIGRTYRYDLVGASTGAIGLMLALIVLFPDVALKVVALCGFLAAALAISVRETGVVRKGRAVGYATAAIAGAPHCLSRGRRCSCPST